MYDKYSLALTIVLFNGYYVVYDLNIIEEFGDLLVAGSFIYDR